MAGTMVAGALLTCAAPSFAQRSRGGDDKKDDSRPVSRPESKPESRPAPREDRPVFRQPMPSPAPIQRDAPRAEPRWTPAPQSSPRSMPEQRPVSVDNSPSWRGNQTDRKPDNGGIRPTVPVERPAPILRGGNRDVGQPGGSPDLPNSRGGRGSGPIDNGSLRPRAGTPGDRVPTTPTRGSGLGRRSGPSVPGGITGWRPPSRVLGGDTRPSDGSSRAGHGARNGAPGVPGYRTGIAIRNIPTGRGYHPPVVDHNRWRDGGRQYGGRHFFTIDLGIWDPCYRYNWGVFVGVNFYYPYYYCGPYISGYYQSPFWCYGNWAPVYICPERVVYVEKRVYLHDVVDDDYDLYSTAPQTSMRDTMEDIKAAWLDGDGGRLLEHVNQAIPVRIYQKGEYKYSLEPDDFRDVTKDALNRVQTKDFEWTNVEKTSAEEVHLEAKHTLTDPDGEKHVIRLTYTLEKARGSWWITETGTEKWESDI